MTFSIDRSALMTLAWHAARQEQWSRRLPAGTLRSLFPDALRSAWKSMKARAAYEAQQAAMAHRPSADLWAEIQNLENRDRLGHEGIAQLSDLRRAYDASCKREAEEAAAADMERKRQLIASAKGRFASVTFTKKDGSIRVMRVQPATLRQHVKGPDASEPARRAAQTRAERHPHLLPVWDAEAQAPRSVNLATVSRIAVNGSVHEFRAN